MLIKPWLTKVISNKIVKRPNAVCFLDSVDTHAFIPRNIYGRGGIYVLEEGGGEGS